MNHYISSQSSSSSTTSCLEPIPARQIILDVYYTSVYKDPILMNSQTHILKKQFALFHDSYVLAHKENSKVKITRRKRQTAKLLLDGYEIIAEVKFHKKQNGRYKFSLQRNGDSQNINHQIQKVFGQSFINSIVFVSIKNNHSFSEAQQIKDRDFIKLGKQIYQSRIYANSKDIKTVKLNQFLPSEQKILLFQQKGNNSECKICLQNEGQSKRDYIVSPCKCSGSCSGVHVECLKNWIAQKIQIGKSDKKLHTYDMARFACQICKEKYPEVLQIQNSIIDISPELKLKSDTLVLSRIFPYEDQKKCSHFINLQKGKALTIGRHYINELILEDMSISRNHAAIFKNEEDKKFYLQDKNSRFGTFVSLKSQINDLSEAVLLNMKQTFRFRLIEEQTYKYNVSSIEDQLTQEKIEYQNNY